MRRFRKWFALLFVLSIFVTVAHELSHDHLHDETCEICLLSHTPVPLDVPLSALSINPVYDVFPIPDFCHSLGASQSCRSRSPPFS
ncbi:MAG: hypothetical protein JXK04_07135 [Campylobacterales bacterium]|nr:hypothetical protein [Campylobacterales bacterium]